MSPRVKAEFDQIRERADAAGFDVGATLRETISHTVRQIRSELDAIDRKGKTQPPKTSATDSIGRMQPRARPNCESLETRFVRGLAVRRGDRFVYANAT